MTLAQEAEWIGLRIFFPASLLLLAAGIGLVVVGNWGFGTPWVLIGIGGMLFSAVVGATFLSPQSKQIGMLIEQKGTNDPEVVQRLGRVFLVSRIELAVLLLVVLDMTIKPG